LAAGSSATTSVNIALGKSPASQTAAPARSWLARNRPVSSIPLAPARWPLTALCRWRRGCSWKPPSLRRRCAS